MGIIILPIHCRLGRTALSWGVRDLARKAKVSPNTVARFERGEAARPETITLLQRTMEQAGVEFTNGNRPGVRLRDKNEHLHRSLSGQERR